MSTCLLVLYSLTQQVFLIAFPSSLVFKPGLAMLGPQIVKVLELTGKIVNSKGTWIKRKLVKRGLHIKTHRTLHCIYWVLLVSVYIYIGYYLSVYIYIGYYLSVNIYIYIGYYLSVYIYIGYYLSVYIYIVHYLSVYIYIYRVLLVSVYIYIGYYLSVYIVWPYVYVLFCELCITMHKY